MENFQQSKNMELLTTPPSEITSWVKNLSTNLTTLKPDNSEVTQLITYALIATAVVGIIVYHYIKHQERSTND